MFSIFKQKRTYIFLILSIISIVAAFIVSIPDNPPGIILGFLSSVFFILAFTHNWEKVKHYVLLTIVSLGGFVVSAILSNVFETIGKGTFLEKVGIFFFLLAIFLCPGGILIGIIGSLVKYFNAKKT
jgi:hypothetical protein